MSDGMIEGRTLFQTAASSDEIGRIQGAVQDHDTRLLAVTMVQQRMQTAAAKRDEVLDDRDRAINTKLDEIIRCLGHEGEDDHGTRIGTGVVGRLMRLEVRVNSKFALYERWTQWATGAMAAATVLFIAIWWFARPKLEALFGLSK